MAGTYIKLFFAHTTVDMSSEKVPLRESVAAATLTSSGAFAADRARSEAKG